MDATTGGGGHSLAMLGAQPDIRLFCIDQDDEAIAVAKKRIGERAEFIKANFAQMRTELAFRQVKGIDGILFDLGVSSHQLDEGSRGFSFDKDAPLDMRMDRSQSYTAFNAVNELDARQLAKIFKDYSEELNATRIAKAIERADKPINSTKELAKIIESVVGVGSKESLKSKVRIFQALRIHVNNELGCLELALQDAINLLNPEGRIVVLSYHSLEDRIAKQTFRLAAQDCICPAGIPGCNCDHQRQLSILTKSPLVAREEETRENPRSRSAKLRAAEKVSPSLKGQYSKSTKKDKPYRGKDER